MKLDTILAKVFRSADPALAFDHFLPLVSDFVVPKGGVFQKDAAIARHNVERAMSSIIDRLPDVARRLPAVDVGALAELPSLALAVVHAADRVPAALPSARTISAKLADNRPMRAATLSYLEIAARLGLVPAGRVRAIRAGRGQLDEARDAVAIVALFREFEAALAGKHPFADEYLKALATNGAWLVQAITPMKVVPAARSGRGAEALDRDRLVMLLEARYDQLRTAGVVCFGIRHVDAKVPPLWSATRDASAPAAPAPTPAPVA